MWLGTDGQIARSCIGPDAGSGQVRDEQSDKCVGSDGHSHVHSVDRRHLLFLLQEEAAPCDQAALPSPDNEQRSVIPMSRVRNIPKKENSDDRVTELMNNDNEGQ